MKKSDLNFLESLAAHPTEIKRLSQIILDLNNRLEELEKRLNPDNELTPEEIERRENMALSRFLADRAKRNALKE